MIMTWSANRGLSTIFFIVWTLMAPSIFCAARDTITRENPISHIYSQTLISASNRFQLGFFAYDGDSGHSRYLGIWDYRSNPQTIVSVANRDGPLHVPTGVFAIAEDGNLEVIDGNGNGSYAYFSTNLESLPSSNTTVKLLDSGNLVLSDDLSGTILWQSFDHPADTFLPGMKMDANMKLTSWKRLNDPGNGNFTFQKDNEREDHYIILKRSIKHWKSGDSGRFDDSDKIPDAIAFLLSNFSRPKNPKILPLPRPKNMRLLMSSSGELQYFNWDNDRWSLKWSVPRDPCSVYNACGDFGRCNSENSLVCNCFPGFEPGSPHDWNSGDFSSGCRKKTTTCLTSKDNYTFLKLKVMKVENPDSPFNGAKSEEDCKKECLSNCQCQAYSYGAGGGGVARRGSTNPPECWTWTADLKNLQEHVEGQHELSIRVALADIESTERNCKACGANIIPYPLSTGPSCGDPMYYNFRCNNSAGQVDFFPEPSRGGNYRVTTINPENRSFIIQLTVKNAVLCPARNLRPEVEVRLLNNASLPYNVNCSRYYDQSAGYKNVEINWDPPREPTCSSLEECKDWPNSSCDKAADGKRRCLCNASSHWDAFKLNCTQLQGTGNNPRQLEGSRKKKNSFSLLPVIISTAVTILVVLLCISGYIRYRRRTTEQRRESRENRQGNQVPHLFDTERRVKNLIDSGDFKDDDKKGIDVPFFDLQIIIAATNNFSDENKLGQGGFGPVYKGMFPGGQEIAVKRLSIHSGQGLEEFKNEVVLIAKLQHRNLVRLLGYCVKGEEKILLYEYMPNKSLDAFIFDRTLCMSLEWVKRLNIILGVARGLLYLHQDSRLRIIHRDLKTSNILLDEEMNPKISDFGLARIVGGKETEANTNRVVGTYGYMSPEYALDGIFSIKSDVFSFGVIVLEIVSGKRNTRFYESQQAFNLLGYAWRFWKEEKALDLMDQALLESCNSGEVMKCITVGLLCVQEDPSDRPTMPNVVFMLGSEIATLPNPKQPAFIGKTWLSSTPSSSHSSSIKPETISNIEMTVSIKEPR